ncbi:ATP-dependent zinc protease family protein [Adhaeretor mobilis]|uniref:Retropepsin-like aspartic endopeptidase domain-containing protein n=1 Tax=Adhaeretor mobilis TaxID=1930276 RepID=A0A517N1I8_9BACT|nr:ATP-dependent zinc protease [Adhaeretor mobilis]QDT00997.1 hypothetical protein HG15A2_43390 [Adhaeretor mobilis]
MRPAKPPLPTIGWREWTSLPELGISQVKPKIDTGARSSSLHARHIEIFQRDGSDWVRFEVQPVQRRKEPRIVCEAPVLEQRYVKSSSGHTTRRVVIRTTLELAGQSWAIDLTLASRDQMGFRMLLGREAVRGRFLVDPAKSYLQSQRPKRRLKKKQPKGKKPKEE